MRSDVEIEDEVRRWIEGELDGASVCVSATRGRVILCGVVEDEADRQRAAEIAMRVAGVDAVTNELEAKPDWAEERGPLRTEERFTRAP
jgi:osmotically-inducible protein OsmY